MFVGESLGVGLGMSPGADLARRLAGVDRYSLSGHDRIELLKARSRLRAHVDAELLADMVAVLASESEMLASDLAVDQVHEVAAAEVGAALS
jgi:predicted regulator of Ras-like GTPase activity (Roadblock/LC7/MglB family)